MHTMSALWGGTGTRSNPWKAYGVVLAAGFMALLDVSIVGVAIPAIEAGLHANNEQIQWMVAAYPLAFGIGLVPSGRLGDIAGRRTLFLIGLVTFTLASLACGLSTTGIFLVIARCFQGVCAGVLSPQIIAFIQDLFPPSQRARAFGYFGMTMGLSTAVGPLLGGVLISALGSWGWRAVFLINVFISFVIIPLALRFLPKPESNKNGERGVSFVIRQIDMLGILLIAVVVLCLMLPFVMVTSTGSFASAPWWLWAVAVVLSIIFIAWENMRENHHMQALIPRAFVRNQGFFLGVLLAATHFAGFTGIFIITTIFYQQGLGTPAWVAGLTVMPFALAGAISSAHSGHMSGDKARTGVVYGIVLLIIGWGAIFLTGFYASPTFLAWATPLCMAVAGWGGGAVISSNQVLSLAEIAPEDIGAASSVLQLMQRLGSAIGIALITTIFFAKLHSEGPKPVVYSHAFALATFECCFLLALMSIVIAIIDMRRRKRKTVTLISS